MGFEQPQSKSKGFGFYEEWEALGGMVLEFPILPIEILGDLASEAFDGFVGE